MTSPLSTEAAVGSDPDTAPGTTLAAAEPVLGSGAVRRRLPVLVAIVLVLAAVPLVAPAEVSTALTRVLAVALLAVSLDLLVGIGGMPSLGHALPFGVGAYAAGLTAKEITAWAPVALLVAVVAAAVASAAVGWLVVRSRGTYLLMLTLAVAELVQVLAGRWQSVTGGTNGLVGIPSITFIPGGQPVRLAGLVYWWVLAVAVAGFVVLVVVARSSFGRTLRGIRDNEERMSALGYSTQRAKYVAFCLAGALGGAAGALWTAQARFVSPTELGFEVSALALLAVVIGGRGSLWGAVLGAALVSLVRDELGPQLGGRGPLLLGLVFLAVVYLLPRGFAGLRLPRRRDRAGAEA